MILTAMWLGLVVLPACGDGEASPVKPNLDVDAGEDSDTDVTEDVGPDSDVVLGPLMPRFEPDGEGFYRIPWPSDARVLSDGTVDLADFPDVENAVLTVIREALEGTLHGFSTMPVGYIALDRDPDAEALSDPAASVLLGADLMLMAVSEGHCGERVPIEVQVSKPDRHLDANVLEMAPVPGFVLRQGVIYAFVVNRSFGREGTLRPAAFDAALNGDGTPLGETYGALRSCVATLDDLSIDDIAVATVFTTQDVLTEARALRDAVRDASVTFAPHIDGWELNETYSVDGEYVSHVGTYETPIFQAGVSPYTNRGGAILFDEAGVPIMQGSEPVPMIVTVPVGAPEPMPVFIWVDGTGWGQWTHVRRSVTQDMLAAGFVVASYMPQFHGDRATPGSDTESSTYNFLNPEAGRNVLRQQLADTSFFVELIKHELSTKFAPGTLDVSSLVMGGQSQGAQNGAFVAAVEPDIEAYVLNGLSAYLSITILERKDISDYEALLALLVKTEGDLDRFYPVIQLLQMGADTVDPQNYVGAWSRWAGNPTGANVFVLNGFNDDTTHPIGIDSLTIAGDMGIVDPPGWDVDPFDVWNRDSEGLPIVGNRSAPDGSPITVVTYLDPSTGHFTIYDRADERARAVDFLVDALDGIPTLRQ